MKTGIIKPPPYQNQANIPVKWMDLKEMRLMVRTPNKQELVGYVRLSYKQGVGMVIMIETWNDPDYGQPVDIDMTTTSETSK